jgi:cell division protein FtsZ
VAVRLDLRQIAPLQFLSDDAERINIVSDEPQLNPGRNLLARDPIFRVIGLGGAGNNTMDRLALDGVTGIELVAADADRQVLTASVAPKKIQLGKASTRGLGSGGDPEVGYEATAEAVDEIKAAVESADLVFLCVGLGGGIGSGGAPAVASIARQCGARVIALVTMPFGFEGRRRRKQADQALASLKEHSDLVIGFENDRLGDNVAPTAGIHQAFAASDQTAAQAIRAIANLLRKPGLIHLGMADLCRAAAGGGAACLFGYGEAEGDNRVHEALARALKNPLMDKGRILDESASVLVHIMGGQGMTFADVETLMRELNRHLSAESTVSFGVAIEPKLGNKLTIAILGALGSSEPAAAPAPIPEPTRARKPAPAPEPREPAAEPSTPVPPPIFEPIKPEPQPAPEPERIETPAVAAEGPTGPGERQSVADEPEQPAPAEVGQAADFPAGEESQPPAPDKPAQRPGPARPGLPGEVPKPAKDRQESPAAKKAREERQEQLMFEPISRGRFDKSEPTIVDGQDLDVPTFLRMNVKVK